MQPAQLAAPGSEENLEAGHAVHDDRVVALATDEYMPAGHAVQPDVPEVSALYVPATQAVHTADVDAAPAVP